MGTGTRGRGLGDVDSGMDSGTWTRGWTRERGLGDVDSGTWTRGRGLGDVGLGMRGLGDVINITLNLGTWTRGRGLGDVDSGTLDSECVDSET